MCSMLISLWQLASPAVPMLGLQPPTAWARETGGEEHCSPAFPFHWQGDFIAPSALIWAV